MISTMIGGKLEYDHCSQDWDIFRCRFIQFCTANDINDETDKTGSKRRAVLLTAFIEDTYRVAKDLVFPAELENLEFVEILETLSKHFAPKRSSFAERFNFYKAEQRPGEDLSEWATRVRKLARYCGFHGELGIAMRDRFVLGLENAKEKEKLFAESVETLTFEKAIELARNVRCARLAVKSSLTGKSETTPGTGAGTADSAAQPIFAIRTSGKVTSGSTLEAAQNASQGKCEVCGYKNHTKDKCRFINFTCKKCKKKGHLQRVCIGKFVTNHYMSAENDDEQGIYNLFNIEQSDTVEPILQNILLGSQEVVCEIDCGSAVSVLPASIYQQNLASKYKLEPCKEVFKFYTGVQISPKGCVTLPVTCDGNTRQLKFFVIGTSNCKSFPLLGRDFMKIFKLGIGSIDCNSLNIDKNEGEIIMNKYAQLFSDELGTFNKYKINLKMRPDAKLKFFKPRPVPMALKPKVEKELDRLVSLGILEKIDHSDVATPIVPVLKPDGNVRICGDFSVTLNQDLYLDHYTIPRIEELFAKLHGGVAFSKLDLSQAYLQLELDDSKKWTCINTHKGLFRYNRLVFGLANAPFIFQRTIEQLLGDIEGVCTYLDDILITAPDTVTHIERLNLVLNRLQEAGLRLKKDKCELFRKSVEYLGFVIDKEGLHKSERKVEAILKCRPPKNTSELKSFLGMVNYYRCFVPGTSSVLEPLNSLLKKGVRWIWGVKQAKAFNEIKQELVSDRVLAHYNPEFPTIVTCDAGPLGLGAVLSQRQPDGKERVVAYASRALSKAETNYAQIQKEATSIVFGIKKFHHYLYGRTTPFVLRTDHKPLLAIFGKKKGVPVLAANRLQRYALFLSAYNFEIEYVKSDDNVADFLSRAIDAVVTSAEQSTEELNDSASYINFIGDVVLPPITLSDIKKETIKDEGLQKVVEFINKGWPAKVNNIELKPFHLCRNELSVENGCILRGHKVIIPKIFRERLLEELHQSHFGVVKTKSEARGRMWWPNIDKDIETKIGSCNACNIMRNDPPQAPLAPWPFPRRVWERVHLDMFTLQDKQYLVAVDAHSKWVECFLMQKTDSSAVVSKLGDMFSRFGLVRTLVTDNATNFSSKEFNSFCQLNGIQHLTIAPYHPASNGQAENSVKTVKRGLKAILKSNGKSPRVIEANLNKFLFDYRNSVHCTTGFSPAQLMFGRPLRCRLDLLRVDMPSSLSAVSEIRIKKPLLQNKGTRKTTFKVNDRVLVKHYYSNGNKHIWKRGIIKNYLGSRMFNVYVPELDLLMKKHMDQLLIYKGDPEWVPAESGEEEDDLGEFFQEDEANSNKETHQSNGNALENSGLEEEFLDAITTEGGPEDVNLDVSPESASNPETTETPGRRFPIRSSRNIVNYKY